MYSTTARWIDADFIGVEPRPQHGRANTHNKHWSSNQVSLLSQDFSAWRLSAFNLNFSSSMIKLTIGL